ncbi:DNA-3-methyladenine glycosylase 2 [Arthrobacter halodurans]|uniref:DNA-3-methyladenine glycosylase II n=1 Tax=Arthrobacter halodurans TaxID=516699 RepID=A0ABV4URW1_9MICC
MSADPGTGTGRARMIRARGGLAAGPLLGALAAHAIPGVDVVDRSAGTHRRAVPLAGGYRAVTLSADADGVRVLAALRGGPPSDAARPAADAGPDAGEARELEGLITRWLDLDTDLAPVNASLRRDPVLAPLVSARPGLRIVGYLTHFEAAATTVLGQQVSLAAARTFAGRLVSAFGADGPGGLRLFPEPGTIAALDPEELRAAVGVTRVRARTVHAVAAALAAASAPVGGPPGREIGHGGFPLSRAELLALPGIGPWTADYLAVRAARDRDAFAPGDLVLRRALGGITAREAAARAERWRPYRAHALFHLWTAAAYP